MKHTEMENNAIIEATLIAEAKRKELAAINRAAANKLLEQMLLTISNSSSSVIAISASKVNSSND
jgi:hypothetical protein